MPMLLQETRPLLGSDDALENLRSMPIMVIVGTGNRPSPMAYVCVAVPANVYACCASAA